MRFRLRNCSTQPDQHYWGQEMCFSVPSGREMSIGADPHGRIVELHSIPSVGRSDCHACKRLNCTCLIRSASGYVHQELGGGNARFDGLRSASIMTSLLLGIHL
eukprot:scaffold159502_cov33-Tisochrysis_lutea.AAC.2